MEDSEINNLIILYQNGNDLAINELCKEFLPMLVRTSEKIWYKVKNNAEFECRCLLKLERALKKFDPSKGQARSLIINVIVKERSEYINWKRGRYHPPISFEQLRKADDEGNEMEFDIKDVLADVEQEALLNEKIALLAKGNSLKLAILNAWKDGFYNDLDLSRMLAHSFGGKQESYRKYIQRFRIACRNYVSAN